MINLSGGDKTMIKEDIMYQETVKRNQKNDKNVG